MEKKNLRCKKIISYKNMGDKLSIVNNTCHLCKSIITLDDFHPCKNKIYSNNNKNKKSKGKKAKFCKKIFCMNCYEKYFPNYLVNSKFNMNLNCPSCEGLCLCKACAKNKEKQDLENENLILLGKKRSSTPSNNKVNKKDSLVLKIEKLGNKIKTIFPNIEGENRTNKKNYIMIPLIEPSEFQLIKQYNLNLNKIINNINED